MSKIFVDTIEEKTSGNKIILNNNLKVDSIEPKTNSGSITINNPCFHVTKNADQSIADATVQVVTFESTTDGAENGVIINKGGLFANNKFTVTAATTGIYYFYTCLFTQSAGVLSDSYVYFRKNGTTQMQTQIGSFSFGSYTYNFQVYGNINLANAGDYVEVVIDCDQASSQALSVNYNANYYRTEFGGYKVR